MAACEARGCHVAHVGIVSELEAASVYEDNYHPSHLMDHRHGRPAHIGSTIVGMVGVAVILTVLFGIGYLIYSAVRPSGCQSVMHQDRKTCETYGGNHQVVYVPWLIWTNGGSYRGVSYGSAGDGSTYSRSYGYAGDSDPGTDQNSSFGSYDGNGGSSDSGSSGDSGFSGGGGDAGGGGE
jgi:hypothetical protein